MTTVGTSDQAKAIIALGKQLLKERSSSKVRVTLAKAIAECADAIVLHEAEVKRGYCPPRPIA